MPALMLGGWYPRARLTRCCDFSMGVWRTEQFSHIVERVSRQLTP
jgi:hypothetical protein